jgi:hypothetical protein
MFVNLIVTILSNVAPVMPYSIMGAAIATALGLAFTNLSAMGPVYWKLYILTLPVPTIPRRWLQRRGGP